MNAISHLVKDLSRSDRTAIEHLIGSPLTDQQSVEIRVVDSGLEASPELPDWCDVFKGLNEEQRDELVAGIKQRDRHSRVLD